MIATVGYGERKIIIMRGTKGRQGAVPNWGNRQVEEAADVMALLERRVGEDQNQSLHHPSRLFTAQSLKWRHRLKVEA